MDPNIVFVLVCVVFPPIGYVAAASVLADPHPDVFNLFLAAIPSIIGTLVWLRFFGVRALLSGSVITAAIVGVLWYKNVSRL
jgi:hypothetical protein